MQSYVKKNGCFTMHSDFSIAASSLFIIVAVAVFVGIVVLVGGLLCLRRYNFSSLWTHTHVYLGVVRAYFYHTLCGLHPKRERESLQHVKQIRREQKITITGTIFLALFQLLKKKLSFTLTKPATGYISLQNITSKVTNLTAKQNLRNLCYVLCLK